MIPRPRRVLAAFGRACQLHDGEALRTLLTPDAELTIDTGGVTPFATQAQGRSAVADLILELLAHLSPVQVMPGHVNGRPGLVLVASARVVGVLNASSRGSAVQKLWIVVNPEKLAHWNGS